MTPARRADVLIVSLGSTSGLRIADEELAQSLRAAGASVEIASARRPRELRTLMLTDLAWARAAREAAQDGIAKFAPRSIVYSSTTAALFWPRPGAIRFDAPAVANRPGRHGLWQRPLERRRLLAAPLLLPHSEGGLREAALPDEVASRALVLPLPVEPSMPPVAERDIAAITYAANPAKKGLDRVLVAWRELRAARDEEPELIVAGASDAELAGADIDLLGEPGVRSVGRLPSDEYRALLRRARVFVCAPRREDYGSAQMEALAEGCLLVTTAAPGPYVALPIARALDARLVGEGLVTALGEALDHADLDGYRSRALEMLAPYRRASIDARIAGELLPRLFASQL